MEQEFESFGRLEFGKVITENSDVIVVNALNPFGTKNLVLVCQHDGCAIRHGNSKVLEYLNETSVKTFRKALKHVRRV